LLALQKEKGNICVSIIVPTHRTSPDRRVDEQVVKNAMEKARDLLRYKYPEKEIEPLFAMLDSLYESIDFTRNQEGIGLYASPNLKLAIPFPFPVEEKIMVDKNFEIRDLLYRTHYAVPYYVLVLGGEGARLFEGRWEALEEIKDSHFPMHYEDDYEYSKPSRSSSHAGQAHVKSFERDKSELEATRLKVFFRAVDRSIGKYLIGHTPLVLMGAEKEIALYTGASSNLAHIIARISGSYNHQHPKELADMAWPPVRRHLENGWKNLVKEFEEKIGERRGTSGIQEIWNAVLEGKGQILLVEKDYRVPGFIGLNENHLYLRPPKRTHKVLADAVDELIETVLEKDGEVYFVDNGVLEKFERIALITRY